MLDWLAVNDADPFTDDRADYNSIRVALATLAPHSRGSTDLDAVFQVPFGHNAHEDIDYSELAGEVREQRETERASRGN